MRFSPVHLSNFWPVILTEFFRVLEQFLDDEPADTPEAANVLLSACKFIDLLLVLQIEEFQVHQWIFISDTVDAIYHANEWSPEGMLDRLADVVDTKGGVDRTVRNANAYKLTTYNTGENYSTTQGRRVEETDADISPNPVYRRAAILFKTRQSFCVRDNLWLDGSRLSLHRAVIAE